MNDNFFFLFLLFFLGYYVSMYSMSNKELIQHGISRDHCYETLVEVWSRAPQTKNTNEIGGSNYENCTFEKDVNSEKKWVWEGSVSDVGCVNAFSFARTLRFSSLLHMHVLVK